MSRIELIHGSCADQEVDAVVNAANKYLYSGSGICGEIFRRNGFVPLEEACSKIKTPLNDGDAVITPAFNMPNTKHIIHAVGPNFNNTPKAFNELQNAYYNSLNVLKNNNLHSIAFPLISSGIFGGNLEHPAYESAKQCLDAYNKFTLENEDYELLLKLCAFSEKEYEEIKGLFEEELKHGK